MRQHIVPILIITAAALGTAACSEDQDRPPTAPDFHTVIDKNSDCDFTHLRQLANSFFSTPQKQVVREILDDMDAAVDFSAAAKGFGFDVLAQIDGVVNSSPPTAGDPNVGSDLINHLILCMYDPQNTADAAAFPETFPESFAISVTPALHGAFTVPAPASSSVIKSRPTANPFSAIALTTGTWGGTLSGNTPARVLFYGKPGATTVTFDWKTLPKNAGFAPDIVVAVCLDATTNPKALLNEEDVGLLPFVDATFLAPPDCSPSSAMDLRSPLMLAKRLIRYGTSLISPDPLMAAAFSPGGVGGRTSGIGSDFGPSEVSSASLSMGNQPVNTKVNQVICGQAPSPPTCPPVTVLATASLVGGGSEGIPNTRISVVAVNNNGVTVVLDGTKTQVTDGDGIARFSNLSLNKTGSYRLVFAGTVIGRPAITVSGVTSAKFLEAPSK